LASVCAACATTVRPLGIFALVGLAVALLVRREWKRLAGVTAVGLAIGLLYALPLTLVFGDPLANLHWYQRRDWDSSAPFTLPFVGMVRGFFHSSAPLTNLVKVAAWLLLVLGGVLAMAMTARFRAYVRKYPAEGVFVVLYTMFLLSYNSRSWAWAEFPRFAIPILPFVFFALERVYPKHRAVLYPIGAASVVLAALSAVNIRHAVDVIQTLFGV
jgi:hypothetical protein